MRRSDAGPARPSLSGKTAIVVGLGTSGRAAAELLASRGATVIATDSAPTDELPASVRKLDCQLIVGGHEQVPWQTADMIVVSPGVPSFPELDEAEAAGCEVIGETELASRFIDVPIVAVGGTNGKSSTTVLLGHLLEAAEKRIFLGGNLGEPACEAPDQEMEIVVFEVSSFQMERVPTFRPHIALMLNLGEDHLDRYDGFDAYAAAKGQAFGNQEEGDFSIYLSTCPQCKEQAEQGRGKKLSFGPGGDYYLEGASVVERATGERFDLSDADLHGRHNYLNAAAAISAARILGVSASDIEEGLRRFRALPHRMALSGRFQGVSFYDDSKATNVEAAVTALRGLSEEKGVLVAGGRDKMGSFDGLVAALAEKGRAAILLGEAAPRLAEAIGDTVPVEMAQTMEGAVLRALQYAQAGDAVLLSPACSSLDMFKNYSDRGNRFTEAVESLSGSSSET